MSAHFPRRLALLLSIVLPLLYFQCKPAPPTTTTETTVTTTTTTPPRHPGWPPEGRYKPTITVDTKTFSPSPKVAVIWDAVPDDLNAEPPLKAGKDKVRITWKANDPQFKLGVRFVPTACAPVQEPRCEGPQCTAEVTGKVTENVVCGYEMFDKSTAKTDEPGDIVVMPCCQ